LERRVVTSSSRAPSAVDRTILLLRADSAKMREGGLIGSEEELLSRYGVSRPTLRQAAALVAQEQLVKVRRGVSGGYFATRPTVGAVSHMAAIYLQTHGADVEQMLHSIDLIRADMVRLAAAAPAGPAREDLRQFLEEDEAAQPGDYSRRRFARAEREYSELLGALCGNNALHLFLQILLDLLGMLFPVDQMIEWTPDRLIASALARGRVIRAILDGDAELAALEARSAIRRETAWIAGPRTR
jgi:DNA-binding FadR family transcriptional regulator